ncbi:hypothetical protein [Streptomyces sp. NPDC001388]
MEVVRAMYHPDGATALWGDSPLKRHFRDAGAVTADIQVPRPDGRRPAA